MITGSYGSKTNIQKKETNKKLNLMTYTKLKFMSQH